MYSLCLLFVAIVVVVAIVCVSYLLMEAFLGLNVRSISNQIL